MNILEYENLHEDKQHGNSNFPYVTYPCSIPLDFPSVPAHWHDEAEIIYVKKGRLQVTVDFESYYCKEGSIVIVTPGRIHSIEQAGSWKCEYENIIFNLDILKSRIPDSATADYISPVSHGKYPIPTLVDKSYPQYSAVAGAIDAADEICKTWPVGYELAIKSQLFNLFFTLISSGIGTARPKHTPELDRMRTVVKHIENNYANKITIEDIARVAGVSESHFMKMFKNTMGVSFIEYLNDYRLTMAARLLLSSSDSITTIAADCGFENLSYFNRLFMRKFSVTPRQYRKGSSSASHK